MEAQNQIATFKKFFEEEYLTELLERSRKGIPFIGIDFQKIAKFHVQLSEELLETPAEVIKGCRDCHRTT